MYDAAPISFQAYVFNSFTVSVIIISVLLAALTLWLAQRKQLGYKLKIALLYMHLFLLLLPTIQVAAQTSCALEVFMCQQNGVISHSPLIIIGAFMLALILGYFVIPNMYATSYKAKLLNEGKWFEFIALVSRKRSIKAPRLYVLDTAIPRAFSFSAIKSKIFISVGMLELLSDLEIQAVLLHEIGHIERRSSLQKLLLGFARVASPLATFSPAHNDEEIRADAVAVEEQGTSMHLRTAYARVREYLNYSL